VSDSGGRQKTTYFFDACLAPKLVQILNLLQDEDILVHMRDTKDFDVDEADVDWIPRSRPWATSW